MRPFARVVERQLAARAGAGLLDDQFAFDEITVNDLVAVGQIAMKQALRVGDDRLFVDDRGLSDLFHFSAVKAIPFVGGLVAVDGAIQIAVDRGLTLRAIFGRYDLEHLLCSGIEGQDMA